MRVSVLDCTLRDGGNYNSWRFSEAQIRRVIEGLDNGRVDFIEVGYRGGSGSNKAADVGITAHCPAEFLNRLPTLRHARLAVQAVPTVCPPELLDDLVETPTALVRIATYPHNFRGALPMIEHVKELGLQASLNLMSASYTTAEEASAMACDAQAAGADMFHIADSFGALTPDDTDQMIAAIRRVTTVPVGYHGHNNLGLAFANAIAAVRAGATWLDCSLCGLARGAGNLPIEQLVATAQRWTLLDVGAVLEPVMSAAEFVLSDILSDPMRIARPEIESGVFNLHYYYYSLIRARAKEAGVDHHLVAHRLGELRPPSVDVSWVDAVIKELL